MVGIVGVTTVVLAGVAYHFLFGYLTVVQVSGPVHVLQRANVLFPIGANVVVYAGDEETIVVDTQLQPVASFTRAKIEGFSDARVTKVVVTHWHPDHSGGISVYSSNSEVIAHHNVLRRLSRPQEGFGLTKPGSHHEFAPRTSRGLPNKPIDARLEFPANASNVEVVHYPRAHTDGDLAVFFGDAQVVALGDLVWPASFPFVDVHNGGSATGIESALRAIIGRTTPTYRFVPGHGATLSFDDVVDYLEMVRQTREWVESQLDEGLSVDQILASGLPAKWGHWGSALVPGAVWIRMIIDSRTTPDSDHPYGLRHPDAPEQLEQFEFLIGEHTCTDELVELDGTTVRLNARWTGQYILNGLAIQDHYWNERYSASNVRVFDPTQGKWIVTYFRLPDYRSGTWEGGADGNNLILRRSFELDGQVVESRLVFRNISANGFEWTSEYIGRDRRYTNWTSSCHRSGYQASSPVSLRPSPVKLAGGPGSGFCWPATCWRMAQAGGVLLRNAAASSLRCCSSPAGSIVT